MRIVQKALGQADVTPGSCTFAAGVTAGNLLILVGSGRTGGINLTPNNGAAQGRPFTSYGQIQAFLGRGFLDIAYRIATGDEQSLTFFTQHANFVVYELEGARPPALFEVKSKTLQGASAGKSLGAFTTPGALQIAGFIWDNNSNDQSAGAGYTQDVQEISQGNLEPAFLAEHATSGATPQISGGSWAWGGMAIGVLGITPPAFRGEPGGGMW